jgi:TIR domain
VFGPDNVAKPSIFVSYAHEDEAIKSTFVKNLADESLVAAARFWDDRKLESGRQWEQDIILHLQSSAIIFLLVSDHFVQSDYCMKVELRAARHAHESGKARVLVIHLTRHGDAGGAFDGLPSWPSDGPPLREQSSPERALAELRDKTKRLLVDYLKEDEEGALAFLHYTYGVNHAPSRQNLTIRALAGAATSGLAAAFAAPFIFPTVLDGIPTSMWCFVLVFGLAAIAVYATFEIKRLFDKRRFPTSFDMRWMLKAGCLTASATAMQGGIFGLAVGIIVGVFGMSVSLGWAGVTVFGLLFGAFVALKPAFNSSHQKLLGIFRDVGDYTFGHRRRNDPWDDLDATAIGNTAERRASPALVAAGAGVATNDGDRVAASDEDIEHAKALAADAASSRDLDSAADDARPPVRAEDVPLRTVVLVSASDRQELKPLLQVFESTGLADILRIEILTEGEIGADQPEYWRAKLAALDCFIVLVTPRLISSSVHAALVGPYCDVDWSYNKDAVPVRIEEFDSRLSPITRRTQALPSGGLAVADWPITDNARVNIALNIRKQCLFHFFERLHRYHEDRIAADAKSDEHLPWHILALKFPYRRYGFDFHFLPFLRWNALAALVFAAFCHSQHTLALATEVMDVAVLPVLTALIVFGFLAAKRQVARMRCEPHVQVHEYELLSILTDTSLLLGESFVYWAKRKIWISAIWVGSTCVGAGVAIAALMIRSPTFSAWFNVHPLPAGAALGLVVGSLAYVANCRRMPRILMERTIPTHRSSRVRWHRGALEIQRPLTDYCRKDDGVIATLPGHEKEFFRGYSQSMRVSLFDLARASLESTLLVVVTVTVAGLLRAIGLPDLLGDLLRFFAVVFMTGLGLAVLEERLYRSYQNKQRWDYWWRLLRNGEMATPSWQFWVVFLVASIILSATGWLTDWSHGLGAFLFPVAIWAFVFLSRSRQLIVHSAVRNSLDQAIARRTADRI